MHIQNVDDVAKLGWSGESQPMSHYTVYGLSGADSTQVQGILAGVGIYSVAERDGPPNCPEVSYKVTVDGAEVKPLETLILGCRRSN